VGLFLESVLLPGKEGGRRDRRRWLEMQQSWNNLSRNGKLINPRRRILGMSTAVGLQKKGDEGGARRASERERGRERERERAGIQDKKAPLSPSRTGPADPLHPASSRSARGIPCYPSVRTEFIVWRATSRGRPRSIRRSPVSEEPGASRRPRLCSAPKKRPIRAENLKNAVTVVIRFSGPCFVARHAYVKNKKKSAIENLDEKGSPGFLHILTDGFPGLFHDF